MTTATPAISIVTLPFTGLDAIEAFHAIGGALRLDKANDPLEGPREGLTVAEAREIAAIDGGLIGLVAEIEWLGSDEETIGRCGALNLLVQSPDARRGEIEVVIGDLDGDFFPLTMVDNDLVESATTALADHIAATIA